MGNTSIPICTSSGNETGSLEVFERHMHDFPLKGCNCLQNCEEVVYHTQVSYVNFDLDELCSKANPSGIHFVMREWAQTESPSVYWYKKFRRRKSENDKSGKLPKITTEDQMSYDLIVPFVHGLPVEEALTKCRELYKNNIARVTIQISEDSVLMTRRDFSVTYAEQLSIISGTIGLFTGLSLMSIAEALYWIYKLILKIWK